VLFKNHKPTPERSPTAANPTHADGTNADDLSVIGFPNGRLRRTIRRRAAVELAQGALPAKADLLTRIAEHGVGFGLFPASGTRLSATGFNQGA
jgi:hypothetical protein